MAEDKKATGRPKNIEIQGDLKKFFKNCASADVPKIRRRLMAIAMGTIKDERFDVKTGKVVKINLPLSVSVDAINAYGKFMLAKVEADVKADTNVKVEYSVTDALKLVEEKKRLELEKKQQKELEAKQSGKVIPMKKVAA
jgi:hypothetical protein